MLSKNNQDTKHGKAFSNISHDITGLISLINNQAQLHGNMETKEQPISKELSILLTQIDYSLQNNDFKTVINLLEQLKTFCRTRSTDSGDQGMNGITTLDIYLLQEKILQNTNIRYSDIETIDFSKYKKVVTESYLSINDCLHINAYGSFKVYLTKLNKIFDEHGHTNLFKQIENAYFKDKYGSLTKLIKQAQNADGLKKVVPDIVWYDMLRIVQDLITIITPTSHHQNGKSDIFEQ